MALYRYVAESTLDYCMRELLSPEGGYYCGQDADSGGIEGAYYLFTPDEVKKILGDDAGRHFCECYDITPEGNFHGSSIPNLPRQSLRRGRRSLWAARRPRDSHICLLRFSGAMCGRPSTSRRRRSAAG